MYDLVEKNHQLVSIFANNMFLIIHCQLIIKIGFSGQKKYQIFYTR